MSWAGRKSRRHPRPWPGPAGTQGGGRKCNKHVAWDTERGEAVSRHPKLCWSLSLRSPALIRETTCLLEAPMLLTSLCRRVFPLGVTQCWPERSDVRAPPPPRAAGKSLPADREAWLPLPPSCQPPKGDAHTSSKTRRSQRVSLPPDIQHLKATHLWPCS